MERVASRIWGEVLPDTKRAAQAVLDRTHGDPEKRRIVLENCLKLLKEIRAMRGKLSKEEDQ